MQCGRGRGIGEILDGYEECEVLKAFQPRHAHSLQAARVGVASPCSQPEEVPPVVGVRQPMGAPPTRQGVAEQLVRDLTDSGSRSESNLLELSLGELAGRVAQVSWLNFI